MELWLFCAGKHDNPGAGADNHVPAWRGAGQRSVGPFVQHGWRGWPLVLPAAVQPALPGTGQPHLRHAAADRQAAVGTGPGGGGEGEEGEEDQVWGARCAEKLVQDQVCQWWVPGTGPSLPVVSDWNRS